MSNALSPPAPGTPQRDSEARNKRQDRRRPELVAYAATPILAAAGVPDRPRTPTTWMSTWFDSVTCSPTPNDTTPRPPR